MLRIRFTLFIIYGADGSYAYYGPDIWGLRVAGGPRLVHTTFCNVGHIAVNNKQAFPDDFPMGDNPGFTGAAEAQTLGWKKSWRDEVHGVDAVYHFDLYLPHTAEAAAFVFYSNFAEPLYGESWGLESVQVDTLDVPVPLPDAPALAAVWQTIEGKDAMAAHRARWRLAASGPAVIPALTERYGERVPSRERVTQLYRQLGSERFQERREATRILSRMFGRSRQHLIELQEETTPDPEIAFRLQTIFSEWEAPTGGAQISLLQQRLQGLLAVVQGGAP